MQLLIFFSELQNGKNFALDPFRPSLLEMAMDHGWLVLFCLENFVFRFILNIGGPYWSQRYLRSVKDDSFL